jgi:hypothetical protein
MVGATTITQPAYCASWSSGGPPRVVDRSRVLGAAPADHYAITYNANSRAYLAQVCSETDLGGYWRALRSAWFGKGGARAPS